MKKIESILLVGLVIVLGAGASFGFTGGTGSSTDPYLINNCTHLQNMSSDLNAHYALDTSFSCDVSPYNSGDGFEPVGNDTVAFNGSFNGSGYVISDLYINRTGVYRVGLFGVTGSNASITNVSLEDVDITSYRDVGSLIGENKGGNVSGSYATGSVKGKESDGWSAIDIGGLIGDNDGSVSDSYATGSVTGSSNVGGLIGGNYDGSVSSCYSTGSVGGDVDVGGLVGKNKGVVLGSHATGNITGEDDIGGLIGYNVGGTVSNSSATGTVNGTDNTVGGLIGENQGNISDSHATGPVYGDRYVGGLAGTNGDYSEEGRIENSYATGSVNGSNTVGGLIGKVGAAGDGCFPGYVDNSYSTGNVTASGNYVGGLVGLLDIGRVSSSYAGGSVEGNNSVGGLIGYMGNDNSCSDGVVNYSYSTGRVTGDSSVSGFVGYIEAGSCDNSFWDTESSGYTDSDGCATGKNTSEMKHAATFTHTGTEGLDSPWDFVDDPYEDSGSEDVWGLDCDAESYPLLTSMEEQTLNGTCEEIGGPNISLSRVSHFMHRDVHKSKFFDVTLEIGCSEEDCGDVNITLDPIEGCDVINEDCTSACDGLFVNSTSGWIYGSGYDACMDENGNYATFNDSTCDDRLGTSRTGDCAGMNTASGAAYCPSYERNGEEPVQPENCSGNTSGFDFDSSYFSGESSKSIIPTNSSETPFYTSKSSNPYTVNLNQGGSEFVSFMVNATGELGSVYDFIASSVDLSETYISDSTDNWNISIVSSSHAPEVTLNSPEDEATNTSASPTLNISISDPNGDEVDVSFYDVNSEKIGSTQTIPDGSGTITTDYMGLDYNTTYLWYVTATDGNTTVQGGPWEFTTQEEPEVEQVTATTTTAPALTPILVLILFIGAIGFYMIKRN